MCELFGLSGPDEITVNEYLKTFFARSTSHPNGWGVAIFNGKGVSIEKEPVPAYKSRYLSERLKAPVRACSMMAHIRLATCGHMEYENCHPFVKKDKSGRTWTFMHNGTIFNCPVLSKYIYSQGGQTDSERILLYFIDMIDIETARLGHALKASERFEVISRAACTISPHNKVNFMLHDGSMLYIHKNYKGSMFMKHAGKSLIFATAPLDNEDWEEVPLNQLQTYKNGRRIFAGPAHNNEYIDDPEDMKLIFLDFAQL